MNEYRTPQEDRAQDEQTARIQAVLNQAVRDGVSLLAAMELDESPEVVERWVNALWNGLRDGLVDRRPHEDRLAAVVLLLTDRIRAEACTLLDSIEADR